MKTPVALSFLLFISVGFVSAQKTRTVDSVILYGDGHGMMVKVKDHSRHNIIWLNIADYILQKYNIGYDYLDGHEKWRLRGYTFFNVKDKNYGAAVSAYSNWRISKHVAHIIGGSFMFEYIGSFYEDFYLKFRPRGYAIDPRFSTGLVFTAKDRFFFGLDGAIGPGLVFRDHRFKGVFLSVGIGVQLGVKF